MIKFFNIDHASDRLLPDLNNQINNRKHKIFLFTYMDGCMPCNSAKPMWDQLSSMKQMIRRPIDQEQNIVIAKVNENAFGNLVPRLGPKPMAYPSISFFSDFKKKDEFDGMRDPNEFIKWINKNIDMDKGVKRRRKTKRGKQIKKRKTKSKSRKR